MKNQILENILIEDIAGEGKALFRHNGKVFFIKNVIKGDIVTVQIIKNKKDWGEANLLKIEKPSLNRQTPFCNHFGICGGCKWQMLNYNEQVEYKKKEVLENIKRIAKYDYFGKIEIIFCNKNTHYRNKLEFAFSNKTYLTKDKLDDKTISAFTPALGFHTNKIFDKIIPIDKCFLMDDIHNDIRNYILNYGIKNNLTFYDRRQHNGLLRNMMIRITTNKEILLNLIFGENKIDEIINFMTDIKNKFTQINSLYYTINTKLNDTIYDLKPTLFYGKNQIIEILSEYKFLIGPQSFFQTNSLQAEKLYNKVLEFVKLKGDENILDLYCGVGSIGIFISKYAKKILGIEIIKESIEDAKQNAKLNNVNNIEFIQGDIEKLVKQKYFELLNFKIDVLIVDPPRNGLTPNIIEAIINLKPNKIIYISCNSSTQSRDLELLKHNYILTQLAVVDMFPHTQHIETIMELNIIN